MSRMTPLLLAALVTAGFLFLPTMRAEDSPDARRALLVRADTVYPIAGDPLTNGEVLIQGEQILAIGKDLAVPANTEVIEVKGSIMPGWIDCGSTIGTSRVVAEEFFELTPEIRISDNLEMDDGALRRALRAGVTTVAITPGDRNVIGGLGAVIQTAPGSLRSTILKDDAFLSSSLTRAAFRGNRNLRFTSPYSYYHRIPTTRMGTVFLLRRAFFEALDRGLPEGFTLNPETTQDAPSIQRELSADGKRTLAESLRGQRPIRIRADEKQEIRAALRIADEFEAPIVIEGFGEGASFLPEIAKREMTVLIFPGGQLNLPEGSEDRDPVQNMPQLLEQASVSFAFASSSDNAVDRLRERVALDVRFGLSKEKALSAVTLDAAEILGISDSLGSLEAGKRANIVAISGDPLDITARVVWTMVGGKLYRNEINQP